MDVAYEKKFKELQEFIPFLNKMIQKIGQSGDKEKEPQVMKMRSLKEILINPEKKVRFETLVKCEGVLIKLYEKVEGTTYNGKLSASYQTDINKIFNEPKKQPVPVPSTEQNNRLNRDETRPEHENLSDYLQEVHDRQHKINQTQNNALRRQVSSNDPRIPGGQGGSIPGSRGPTLPQAAGNQQDPRNSGLAALRSRLGGISAGLGRGGGVNSQRPNQRDETGASRLSLLGKPPENDNPGSSFGPYFNRGGGANSHMNRGGGNMMGRGGGNVNPGGFGRGGFNNRRGSQDSDGGPRIPGLGSDMTASRGPGQNIPGLGLDMEDCPPGPSSTQFLRQTNKQRRDSKESQRSDGRISPWEDSSLPPQGIDRSWLQDAPKHNREPENSTFWQNRVGSEELELNSSALRHEKDKSRYDSGAGSSSNRRRQHSGSDHHRRSHDSHERRSHHDAKYRNSPESSRHHSGHRRGSFDRDRDRDRDKGSSRERDRKSSKDRDSRPPRDTPQSPERSSSSHRRSHNSPDDRHRSSHDRYDRQNSGHGDHRSSNRRSNDPMSPTYDDHRKQDAPKSIPLERDDKDKRHSSENRRSFDKSSNDREKDRDRNERPSSRLSNSSQDSRGTTPAESNAPDLPNPVPTVRQDPRRSRDPRQRPAPPVNVVKPINNAPATAVSPGTGGGQYPAKNLPLPAGASMPTHLAGQQGNYGNIQHPGGGHQFPPRPGFPPHFNQQRPRFPPNQHMMQHQQHFPQHPPRPYHQQFNQQRGPRPNYQDGAQNQAPNSSLGGQRSDPRLSKGLLGSGAASQQPRNYREFRMMKEEQERKRREAEERHRQEMQKYEMPDESTEKTNDDDKKDITEEKSSNDTPKKDESEKEAAKDSTTNNDGKATKEVKKNSNVVDSKAIEQMKKSFKIPKLKKKESAEESKDAKEEKGKLKTFDMFSTDSKSINKVKRDPRLKNEQSVTDLSAQIEKPVEETGKITISKFNSDSDSDHGLTIAEDTELEEGKDEENQKESLEPESKENENKEDKPNLKELLKNLVTNLDPAEAAKMLEMAQSLQSLDMLKLEKIGTLEEFKQIIFDNDKKDNTEEIKPKGKRTPNAAAKQKAAPVKKQTRRSGRNRKPVIEESSQEEVDKESESETETFVIEPKDLKRPKKGRKVKSKKKIEDEIDSDNEQSENPLQDQPSEITDNTEDSTVDNTMIADESSVVTAKGDDTPSTAAKTRMCATKMGVKPAMKSKTWFPGDNRGIMKRDAGMISPPPAHKHDHKNIQVKDPDPHVFFGKDHNIDDVLKSEFFASQGEIGEEKVNELKKISEVVTNMHVKLSDKNNITEEPKENESNDDKQPEEEIKICSKIKLSRPKPEIKEPKFIENLSFSAPKHTSNLIDRLKSKLSVKEPLENETNKEEKDLNLFGVIKSLKQQKKPRLPPALIPIGQKKALPALKGGKSYGKNNKHCLQYLKEVKSEKALESQMSDEGLSSLFRCMSYSCSFTTNDVQLFKTHVNTHTDDKFGALRCSLCFGKACDPTKLVKHIISKHGFSAFQCSYCFVRTRSVLEVFIHQLIFHPEDEKKYLSVHSMKSNIRKENEDPICLNHDLECPSDVCTFTCSQNNPSLLYNHISSNGCKSNGCEDEMIDYLCPYCPFSDLAMITVVIHQTLEHSDQDLKVVIRETELLDPMLMSESEDLDSSSECSTDTELSQPDQDFHDEDIDSLELTEKCVEDAEKEKVALATAAASEEGKDISENAEIEEDLGLAGTDLFKCGNPNCDHAAVDSSAFKDHLMVCECATQEMYYACAHCVDKQFKHVPTLLEHLKAHAVKRFFCSMCDYKSSVLLWTKSHMKQHKVVNTKLVPLVHSKNNVDEDTFLVVPKSSVPRGLKPKVQKDVFGLEDIDKINQKPEICRTLLKCKLCEFSSKVRRNLIKHLNLHKVKKQQFEEGKIQEIKLAVVGPINPPVVETNNSDSANYARMKSLLAGDVEEEQLRAPMTSQELAQMPQLIAENLRYACGEKDCKYITIDDVMLQYHIHALHSTLKEYHCPHCASQDVPFDDMSFHLRCHGELLFKCGYCVYYHWQKRTAEKHVAEAHSDKKLFVRNVRYEEEEIKSSANTMKKVKKKMGPMNNSGNNTPKTETVILRYEPFKCSFCDVSTETREQILAHCAETHEITSQFKCGFCMFGANTKTEVEEHCSKAHARYSVTVLKAHHVDPTTSTATTSGQDADIGAPRPPLWSRNMEGLKHIRGILYDEEQQLEETSKTTPRKIKKEKFEVSASLKVKKELYEDNSPSKQSPSKSVDKSANESKVVIKKEPGVDYDDEEGVDGSGTSPTKTTKLDLDFYPSSCKICQLDKKTISGMKMHIRLIHLGQGKYQCRYCDFTGNLRKPMIGHLKNKHPEKMEGVLEGEESAHWEDKNIASEKYSQEYWKEEWDLPTLTERRAQHLKRSSGNFTTEPDYVPAKKLKMAPSEESTPRGKKRKANNSVLQEDVPMMDMNITIKEEPLDTYEYQTKKMNICEESNLIIASVESVKPPSSPQKPVIEKAAENSPFENTKTFMCTYCPKRSQMKEKIHRHIQNAHPKQGLEYRELSRDQVVAIITRDQTNYGGGGANKAGGEIEYKCFYCEFVANIMVLQTHAATGHPTDVFRVTKCQNKLVTGYLECQLCGHLSPGFEKSGQKEHFHEEHPLENEVVCSKYMFKHKIGPDSFIAAPQQALKFEPGDLVGLEFKCPKVDEDCTFTSKSLPQMNNHLRKHTKTFKCGHCGRTLPDSSEFHRHSALSHGDKIPDLVKDPEAEAEFEALKAIFEWGIQQQIEAKKVRMKEMLTKTAIVARSTARKSTGAECRASASDRCRNVARKSTGAQARCWPETRLTEPYSFYKQDQPTLDRKAIKTKMAMGGMEITLDVEKMSQLVNLETKLVIKDCAKVSLNRDELDL